MRERGCTLNVSGFFGEQRAINQPNQYLQPEDLCSQAIFARANNRRE